MFSRPIPEGSYHELAAEATVPKTAQTAQDGVIASVAKGAVGYLGSALSTVAGGAQSVVSTVVGAGSTTVSAVATVGGKAVEATPHVLVVTDKVLEFVPFGSLASCAVDLTLQNVFFKGMDPNSSQFKEYIEHIQKKDPKKCLLYGVPFAGNVCALGMAAWGYFADKPKEKVEAEETGLPPARGGDALEDDPLMRLGYAGGAAAASSGPPQAGPDDAVLGLGLTLGGVSLGEATASRESFAPSTPRRRVVTGADIVPQLRASTPLKAPLSSGGGGAL
jgi:hypothetical protein